MSYRITARCSGCHSIRMILVDAAGRGRCLHCGAVTTVGHPVQPSNRYRKRLW